MNAPLDSASRDRWPLARVLTLILSGEFGGLMVDIRVEHVDAVREHAVAWLPIVYAAFVALACLAACAFWGRTTRLVMRLIFLLALVIGGVGFYLHNDGHVKAVVTASVNAWTDPKMTHSNGPPLVAPLAFGGLGVIGVIASLKRFNSP